MFVGGIQFWFSLVQYDFYFRLHELQIEKSYLLKKWQIVQEIRTERKTNGLLRSATITVQNIA
jgi:hypothetical protein